MSVDLSVKNLLYAYSHGYFPMDSPISSGRELIWLCPDPRTVIFLSEFHLSRSMKRVLAKQQFSIRVNQDFEGVIKSCADRQNTWISPQMIRAYTTLHQRGFADSVEVVCDGILCGGVYGVKIAKAFFAESMFCRRHNMSKVALWALVQKLKHEGHTYMDCQMMNPHLKTLGAREIPREDFLCLLKESLSH